MAILPAGIFKRRSLESLTLEILLILSACGGVSQPYASYYSC